MNRFELEDSVEDLRDAQLLRYAKEYVRLSIAESDNPQSDAHSMVDLIFAECVRRGKEWLYDKAREMVHKEIADLYATDDKPTRRADRGRLRPEPVDSEPMDGEPMSPEIY
jgi:hypothetical protein